VTEDLNEKALKQAQDYLEGGEQFIILASPQRMRVFTPVGKEIEPSISLVKDLFSPEGPESTDSRDLWEQLSFEALTQRPQIDSFRQGTAPTRYIPVHTPEGFKKFIDTLRWCHQKLLTWATQAWKQIETQYQEYQSALQALEQSSESQRDIARTERDRQEFQRHVDEERVRLQERFRTAIDAIERSYAMFSRIQPYSSRESGRLDRLYLTDVVYAALNRILLIRIAEDKDLVPRKISNGGIRAWRDFVGYIKERYQALLQIAYADLGTLTPDFFERGIFDWYLDADSDLHQALELVFFRLNAFDLAYIDRDMLGDLYQEYLPPRERKLLGEFYTPREVVDYILKHIGWPAPDLLLDPACGSGSFLVRASHLLLADLESRGATAATRLDSLTARNSGGEVKSAVVGLDINPFAVNIAQMNLLFLLLDLFLLVQKERGSASQTEPFPPLPVYRTDSLLSEIVTGAQGGEQHLMALVHGPAREREAILRRDSLGDYGFVVMNPPYVRWERLPQEAREAYQGLFEEVFHGNRDLYISFLKKGMEWLKEEGRLGVIISYGLADAQATSNLRAFLGSHAIERIVPLEWADDVFVSSVNTFILIVRKAEPAPKHRAVLVHGIRSIKELQSAGKETAVDQRRWLRLAPDGTWRLEITAADIPILEKMKRQSRPLSAGYGMERRVAAVENRTFISTNPGDLTNPYPLLDGREVKAWSIEWQKRWIDYDPSLFEAAKTLEFFAAPKVIARRISLTTQVAVDERGSSGSDKPFLALNTAIIVRAKDKSHTLYKRPYLVSALLNSLPIRYYSFLLLRAGVVQKGYSTFYPGLFDQMALPSSGWEDSGLAQRLDSLGQNAHQIASDMNNGDEQVLSQIDQIVSGDSIPLIRYTGSDLTGVNGSLDLQTAQLTEQGVPPLGVLADDRNQLRGDHALLTYVVSRLTLEGRETITKAELENYPVPKTDTRLKRALELLANWQAQKPNLETRLRQVESEIDNIALDAFSDLTPRERETIRKRVKEFPMSEVLKTDLPGAPTKQIAVRYYQAGQRYRP
jgi:hypothetical protein